MKTVVITGSTRGLGLEMAKQFRKNNWNVVICGHSDRNLEAAVDALEDLPGRGGVAGTVCDVSDRKAVKALAVTALEYFHRVDIWINNAGVNQSFRWAWEVEEPEVDFLMNVDLKGTINGSAVAVQLMKKQGFGAIYNVEGMGSNDMIQPHFAIYGTAKRAVTYFTDALKKELDTEGLPILVGKLSPGIMITDFLTSVGSEAEATVLNEETKKVYNLFGDYPDVIAEFLVREMMKNTRSGVRINWLSTRKTLVKLLTSRFRKPKLV